MAGLWRIELLGGMTASNGTTTLARFRTRKTGQLLAYLALIRRREARDVLAARFWPEAPTEAARTSLREALSWLRTRTQGGVGETPLILADWHTIGLNPERFRVDVAEYEELLRRADAAPTADEGVTCLLRAVELYRGPLLPGWVDYDVDHSDNEEGWFDSERRRLESAHTGALTHLADLLEQTGDLRSALDYALQAVSHDPLSLPPRETALRLAARLDQPLTALRQLDRAVPMMEEDAVERATALVPADAAPWVRHFEELERAGLSPQRQERATLDRALAATVLTLPDEEKRLFIRISIFPSTFTAEQVAAICGEPCSPALLRELAGRSLIQRVPPGGEAPDKRANAPADAPSHTAAPGEASGPERYRLLEAVRAFARGRLCRREREALEGGHARYFLRLALDGMERMRRGASWDPLRATAADAPSLLAALDWAIERDRCAAAVPAALQYLAPPQLNDRCVSRAGMERAVAAARRMSLSTSERRKALVHAGTMAVGCGEHEMALRCYSEAAGCAAAPGSGSGGASMGGAGEAEDRAFIGWALLGLGSTLHHREDDAAARDAYAAALAAFQPLGARAGEMLALASLADSRFARGEVAAARALYERSLAIPALAPLASRLQVIPPEVVAGIEHRYGTLLARVGEYDAARARSNASLEIHRELGSRHGIADCLGLLGSISMDQGAYAEARYLLDGSLHILEDLGNAASRAAALGQLGDLAYRQGDLCRARALYEEGLREWRARGHRRWTAAFLVRLAGVQDAARDHAGARALCQEALALCQDGRSLKSSAAARHGLARAALALGDASEAACHAVASIELRERVGGRLWLIESLELAAEVALLLGDPRAALRLLNATAACREEVRAPVPPVMRPILERVRQEAASAPGEDGPRDGSADGWGPVRGLAAAVELARAALGDDSENGNR